jgi:multiple sugar transport system permease protein
MSAVGDAMPRLHVRRRRRRARAGHWTTAGVVQLMLVIITAIFLVPMIWMVSSSLKSNSQIFVFPPDILPNPARWENYGDAVNYIPFGTYFMNSTITSVAAAVGTIISCVPAAYAFGIVKWPGRDLVFGLVLVTIMLPFPVVMLPQYMIYKDLGWLGSLLPLTVPPFVGSFITPYFGSALAIFLLRQFMRGLPREVIDSARVDGAGDWTILWRIIVPMAKPVLITVVLFTFLSAWTAFIAPLIFLTQGDSWTLSLGLQQYQTLHFTAFNYLMAASVVFCIPVLVVFVFAQRYFVQGISLTGVKG